jgi:hypothetical protein
MQQHLQDGLVVMFGFLVHLFNFLSRLAVDSSTLLSCELPILFRAFPNHSPPIASPQADLPTQTLLLLTFTCIPPLAPLRSPYSPIVDLTRRSISGGDPVGAVTSPLSFQLFFSLSL